MAGGWGNRVSRGIGADTQAMGGAAQNMGLEALQGEGDMITVFDDFNSMVKGTDTGGGAAIFEDSGWVLTDVGAPTNDEINMNDPSNVDLWAPSCLVLNSGDADDAGFNMQLDGVNGAVGTLVSTANFPHMFIPETDIGAAGLDNTVWQFGCRIGLRADATTDGSGDWDSKCFIGWAEAGDTGILTAGGTIMTTPIIAQAETGPLVGFCVDEAGTINGVAQRTVSTAYVAGTNYVELFGTGGADGTVANGAVTAGDTMWFDLALRMRITDQSDAANNGSVTFYSRRVPTIGSGRAPGAVDDGPPGRTVPQWRRHGTVLLNQCPNNDVALVPTIEMVNGPTAGRDGILFLDWWTFGCSRFSRISR